MAGDAFGCSRELFDQAVHWLDGPSCLRHDGVIRKMNSAFPGVSSLSGPESHGRRCAAPSPSLTTAHWWNPVACPRWSHSPIPATGKPFQRRGAPHIHLWMVPPISPGRSGRGFAKWLSETWAQVVDHPDAEQKARHRLAGTAIDVRNGLRACDPKRLAIYFTKHSSPNMHGDKEYQHVVPELWREPGRGPGRFWGVYGLKKAIVAVEVTQDAYIAARRIVRRWSRNQAVYGDSGSHFPTAVVPRTATRLVPRIIRNTGVVTHRRVRRRRTLCIKAGWPAATHWRTTGRRSPPSSRPPYSVRLRRLTCRLRRDMRVIAHDLDGVVRCTTGIAKRTLSVVERLQHFLPVIEVDQ